MFLTFFYHIGFIKVWLNIICEGFNIHGDSEMSEEELYNEMFGWEVWKDTWMYNDTLEIWIRNTKRHHLKKDLTTKL